MRRRSVFVMSVLPLLVGCATNGGAPGVLIHQYSYQAQPPALPPGTPPPPPVPQPALVPYETVYESAWDDPSLVIFRNDSYRKVRIEIDGKPPIVLDAYGITADLHLGIGEHRAKVNVEKPTAAHGTWEVVRLFSIFINPEGRSQVIGIYAQ